MVAEPALPVLDLLDFYRGEESRRSLAEQARKACAEVGFFYLRGHGVSDSLLRSMDELSRQFFAQSPESKNDIHMSKGGPAWRGYFSVGEELTKGEVDQKEGLYFGSELGPEHPKVQAGTPLHGRNLFPEIPGFRDVILEYMEVMTQLGYRLLDLLSLSLNLKQNYFREQYGREPTLLFRIFHYPPLTDANSSSWSVGEHTDYGILTILRQDELGGLQVKSRGHWIDAPPIPGCFVINLGDMLERMTGSYYRSTAHRVKNESSQGRLSWPFFFDPDFDADVQAIPLDVPQSPDSMTAQRTASVMNYQGSYGDYLLAKVRNVFPELGKRHLD